MVCVERVALANRDCAGEDDDEARSNFARTHEPCPGRKRTHVAKAADTLDFR
jgi:hypothetical protein